MIKELYQYRELLKTNIKKDIRGKYKGSFLGVLWSFINPLLQVCVYAIIFPYIMRVQVDNYLIFLIVGILPWTFFTNSINTGTVSILFNANIIKKVYFPRIILPVSSVTSALVNFLISCCIILVFVIFSGIGISINLIYLPFIILVQYVLSLGIVFILSGLEIYVRDIEHLINFFLMMLFYATPILYSFDSLPAKFKSIAGLNPMAHIIEGYRDVFFYQQTPDFPTLFIVLLIGIVFMFIGYLIFNKLQKGFAEEL